jgi:hypothetical protein
MVFFQSNRLDFQTLRIPWAREEFEHLCSDPPALRASAGLPPLLSVAAVAIEEVSQPVLALKPFKWVFWSLKPSRHLKGFKVFKWKALISKMTTFIFEACLSKFGNN